MTAIEPTLATRVTQARSLEEVRKKDLHAGDRVLVLLGLAEIRRRSPILEELETKGSIKIAEGMYDLATGVVVRRLIAISLKVKFFVGHPANLDSQGLIF